MKRRIGLSPGAKLRVLKRDRFTCTYCGVSGVDAELHIDHIIPVSKGGSNNLHNLTTACSQCNLKKSDKIIDNFSGKKQLGGVFDPNRRIRTEAIEGSLIGFYLSSPSLRSYIKKSLADNGYPPFLSYEHSVLWSLIQIITEDRNLEIDDYNELKVLVEHIYKKALNLDFNKVHSLFCQKRHELENNGYNIKDAIDVRAKAMGDYYKDVCERRKMSVPIQFDFPLSDLFQ